jgi:5'-phosphate synthase pdxT subunit
MTTMRVGVLALQGAFREHIEMLRRLGHEAVEVRLPEHLEGLDALILPGGESTTMGKLLDTFKLREPLRDFVRAGRPTWGTCAGLILLAHDAGRTQPLLDLMDLRVTRNAFGRQVESFETDLDIPALGAPPFPAVFIRAPVIESVGDEVEVLASLPDGRIVAARQGNLLGTAFHPELTGDPRLHAYFLSLAEEPAPAGVGNAADRRTRP